MVIAIIETEKMGNLLIVGLSAENLRRLQAGEPVHVKQPQQVDDNDWPKGWSVVIFFGQDELAMHAQFVKHGLLQPETKVEIDPRLYKS